MKRSTKRSCIYVKVMAMFGGSGLVLRVAFVAVTVTGAGCYPATAPPPGALSPGGVTWASTHFPGVTADSLAVGRDLFVAKCNGCHGYPDVITIADDRWPGILKTMARKKSHLDAEQSDAILHFVLASRSEQAGR
jgi:hypothetical protein